MPVIGEAQSLVSNLFAQNVVLFDQVIDGMLLILIQPSRNGRDDERKWRNKPRLS
jgi:hypothetical protein